MEIDFPVEFSVAGTPVSHQAKRAESRERWKDAVRNAARQSIDKPHFVNYGPIAVTLYYFPDQRMDGDIDNIAKLVLDACCKLIYQDDSQVERLVIQKFEPDAVIPFTGPSEVLSHAISTVEPILYIRISDDPLEGLS